MLKTIKETAEQFAFAPEIKNGENLRRASKSVLVGLGGSDLAAGLLKTVKPESDIIVHRDYGLPVLPDADLKERLIILSSYSGNTEEVLDAYEKAGKLGLARAAITVGGELLTRARRDGIPFVQMPDLGIQPRSALPLSLKSLLKLIGEEAMLEEAGQLRNNFHPESFEEEGKVLADRLRGAVPVIYASRKNEAVAYNWKIKFNETGKIPAFSNVFPELNHNEMAGFDAQDSTRRLSEKFHFIFLSDSEDHPKIRERMEITAELYRARDLPTNWVEFSGENVLHKIFNSLALADFTADFTAEGYGLEPESVPMVEEFKKWLKTKR